MNTENTQPTEQQIVELVRRFYQRAMEDDDLRSIFTNVIHDWDAHHKVVEDFWSRTLLGTERYQGSPYPLHANLPLKPEHFDRWLDLFRLTATETLPVQAANQVIARAEHMAESFKAGMFTLLNIPKGPSRAYPA